MYLCLIHFKVISQYQVQLDIHYTTTTNTTTNCHKILTDLLVRAQNQLTVNQLPPACNLAACLGLSGTSTCIVSAIGSGDPAALQRCLVNGLAQVCDISSFKV